MTVAEMICSCHESRGRAAARELQASADDRAADRAAAIVGPGTLVVIVRDGDKIRWQLLHAT